MNAVILVIQYPTTIQMCCFTYTYVELLSEKGDFGMFITIVPKFFFFATLGTFIEFNWLIHQVKCPNVSTTNSNLQNGNFVYQSINLSAIVLSL